MFHDNWNFLNYVHYINADYQRFVESKGYFETNNVYEGEISDYRNFNQCDLI